jgi:hypothetical protein
MRAFVTVAALTLSCAAMSGDAVDQEEVDTGALEVADLGIDIGRLGLINEKTEEIWKKLRSDEYHGETREAVAMDSALRRTVWQLNELREELCLDRFMVEKSCGAPYVPKWALESSKVIPSMAELQKREDDLSDRIVSLWDAACDRLRKVITASDTMYYCSIE